jgi:hypothetical protein
LTNKYHPGRETFEATKLKIFTQKKQYCFVYYQQWNDFNSYNVNNEVKPVYFYFVLQAAKRPEKPHGKHKANQYQ